MPAPINVAILEDHQSIIDGYHLRLDAADGIQVVGIAANGEDFTSLLREKQDVDVLIMDVSVPVSPTDPTPIPVLHYIPKILEDKPKIKILVISMHTQRSLVQALADAGVSGYIFKHDSDSIRRLPSIIKAVSNGSRYFYDELSEGLGYRIARDAILTPRQLEILTLCASHPDNSAEQIAAQLGIAGSTVRNQLSDAYERLQVHTKAAAIARARYLGLIP